MIEYEKNKTKKQNTQTGACPFGRVKGKAVKRRCSPRYCMADEPENATVRVFSKVSNGKAFGEEEAEPGSLPVLRHGPPAEGGTVFRESQRPLVRIPCRGAFVWK